ncbi:MAG: tRNA 2-thiouridine(34) synthase MnmA [Sandaracinaceae bacterium]|nr:tRNA 2-thiouridine(34) synthase MnmA [Sandaracinaceae bacterium]
MSGGVDSSVAAALLLEQGHDLVGVTLHLWDASGADKVGRCCAPEDRDDARRTCEALGIPHFVIDERQAFRETVVDPFVRAYRSGTTPSPCVACNQEVKLGRLAALADSLGCARIATGHYARLSIDAHGGIVLERGRDRGKDQSYFLHGVAPAILARMLFPLGHLTKPETRAEGQRLGVPNFAKKDSQELCFVPDGDIGGFVDRRAEERGEPAMSSGVLRDTNGASLGTHEGVHRYTIGQRRGLGLGGGPVRYVLRILPDTAEVVVGDERELLGQGIEVRDARWIGEPPVSTFVAHVQARYRHAAAEAVVTPCGKGFVARFLEPQRALAPGQAGVVYLGERVLGGGTITRAGMLESVDTTEATP